MKISMGLPIFVFLAAVGIASTASALNSCTVVQDCVAAGVTALPDTCNFQSSGCTKPDRFAASASDLASRAIRAARCSRTRTRSLCRFCYELAKQPLRSRYDSTIFHGMLAQAVRLIQDEKNAVCPTRGSSSSSSSSSTSSSGSSSSSSNSSSSSDSGSSSS